MAIHDIDRFRGWALTALYGSMAILALMLIMATFQFWSSTEDKSTGILLMAVFSAITAIVSATTCFRFLNIMRNSDGAPRLAIMPFVFMAITLFTASQLFVAA